MTNDDTNNDENAKIDGGGKTDTSKREEEKVEKM